MNSPATSGAVAFFCLLCYNKAMITEKFYKLKELLLKAKIKKILTKMDGMFRHAIGPGDRREYMMKKGITDRDWHFSLTADDIIKNKIPANVMGCTGRAKLFCKLAADVGLPCFAICTAYEPDWNDVRGGNEHTIGGHQVIAVKIDGQLRMFDPGKSRLEFINTDVVVGNLVDFGFRNMPGRYLITAIMSPDEYAKIDTYQKLRNVYASGDMNNPEFVIANQKKYRKVLFQDMPNRR